MRTVKLRDYSISECCEISLNNFITVCMLPLLSKLNLRI